MSLESAQSGDTMPLGVGPVCQDLPEREGLVHNYVRAYRRPLDSEKIVRYQQPWSGQLPASADELVAAVDSMLGGYDNSIGVRHLALAAVALRLCAGNGHPPRLEPQLKAIVVPPEPDRWKIELDTQGRIIADDILPRQYNRLTGQSDGDEPVLMYMVPGAHQGAIAAEPGVVRAWRGPRTGGYLDFRPIDAEVVTRELVPLW